MRILVLSDWFPEYKGDAAGSFVREQAMAVSRCHTVTVLHLRHPDAERARPRIVETQDENLRVLRLVHGRGIPTTAANLWAVAAVLRRLQREASTPQLLHAHEMGAGLAAVAAGHALRLPVVVSEHSSEFALGEIRGIAAAVARAVFAGADVVSPVSESLRTSLASGGWGGHYRVVPNIIGTERFKPVPQPQLSQRPLILTVAGLEPVKGVEEFVEALALLRSQREDFRATLVGGGQLAKALADRVHELGLSDTLTLAGPIAHDEVPRFMAEAAFVVVPSRWETFSVVLSEAMACGLPVVATAVGPIRERVHADNGILCRAGDPRALADAMSTMLDRYGEYDREAIATEVRSRYSAEAISRLWDQVYAEARARRRARSSSARAAFRRRRCEYDRR